MSTSTNALLNANRVQTMSAGASTLEQVFRKHFRLIYETALHVTGNRYDADDVVQNTFLQLIRNGRSPDSLMNPAGYFRRAATNQALKIVAARKRMDLSADADRFEASAPPDAGVCSNSGRQLLSFIQGLSPAAALMIKLRYIEGLSNRQIAEMLGKTEAVVAVTLYRLRRRLMKIAREEL